MTRATLVRRYSSKGCPSYLRAMHDDVAIMVARCASQQCNSTACCARDRTVIAGDLQLGNCVLPHRVWAAPSLSQVCFCHTVAVTLHCTACDTPYCVGTTRFGTVDPDSWVGDDPCTWYRSIANVIGERVFVWSALPGIVSYEYVLSTQPHGTTCAMMLCDSVSL
jgi:hypothetical protein